MRQAGSVVIAAAIVLVLRFALEVYSQQIKQEARSDAAAATSGQTKLTPDAEEKPESGGTEHDHSVGVGNRFVASIGADGLQHVMLSGGEYYFDPNYIVVKANVPVELKVRKVPGYVAHNIVVRAPDAGIDFITDLRKVLAGDHLHAHGNR